jgi:DnaJ-class molecular chaperone
MYDLQQSDRRSFGGFSGAASGAGPSFSHAFGGGGFANGFESFSFQPGFPFGGGPQRQVVPPARARREFYCSLDEIDAGCSRRVELRNTPLTRLADALADLRAHGLQGASGQVVSKAAALAASLLWRWPRLVFGRPWWLRVPLFMGTLAAWVAQQLPPSPEGVFEFDVQPGWRPGTKVVFRDGKGASSLPPDAGTRPVAFELRYRRHPRLHRAAQTADLVYRTSVHRRRALTSAVTLTVVDLSGATHELVLELDEDERRADTVWRRLVGLGLPTSQKVQRAGGAARGDLCVEVRLRGAPAEQPTQAHETIRA